MQLLEKYIKKYKSYVKESLDSGVGIEALTPRKELLVPLASVVPWPTVCWMSRPQVHLWGKVSNE